MSYQVIIFGEPASKTIKSIKNKVSESISIFGLKIGKNFSWLRDTEAESLDKTKATVALYFGNKRKKTGKMLQPLLNSKTPIIPIINNKKNVAQQIPKELRHLNCITCKTDNDIQRIATALLECLGLLPGKRKVFVSYRRDEATAVALQLFDKLSSIGFDVFLDTHRIAPAANFQEKLWHNLSDSDVMIMLNTKTYFESCWTTDEYGSAAAKGIPIFCLDWPNVAGIEEITNAEHRKLRQSEFRHARLSKKALTEFCSQLEQVRSEGYAMRRMQLITKIQHELEKIRRIISTKAIGFEHTMQVELMNGKDNAEVIVYPNIGIPDARTLHRIMQFSLESNCPIAMVYDEVGCEQKHKEYIDWLDAEIHSAIWLQEHRVAYDLPKRMRKYE